MLCHEWCKADLISTLDLSPAGLKNLGNTCYMNSTLQCLYRVKELRQALQGYSGQPTNASHKLAVAAKDLFAVHCASLCIFALKIVSNLCHAVTFAHSEHASCQRIIYNASQTVHSFAAFTQCIHTELKIFCKNMSQCCSYLDPLNLPTYIYPACRIPSAAFASSYRLHTGCTFLPETTNQQLKSK